jgi:CheY-specific phosphatase CheX
MSNHESIAQTHQVIEQVLEDAAFIFTEELDKETTPDPASWECRGVSLGFEGTPSGSVHVWADNGFMRFAAANMLGIDTDDPYAEGKGIDALKELLNMVVGNYLTEVYGSTKVFELGIPQEIAHIDPARDISSGLPVWIEAEGHPLLFVLHVEE